MTITRTINGKEEKIELTQEELRNAYLEEEHNYDVCDIEIELESECFFDRYGMKPENLYPYLDEIATEKRINIDKYEMYWADAVSEAVNKKIAILQR